jgi:hypothetical protein
MSALLVSVIQNNCTTLSLFSIIMVSLLKGFFRHIQRFVSLGHVETETINILLVLNTKRITSINQSSVSLVIITFSIQIVVN